MKNKQFHQTPKQTSQLAMSHSKLHNEVNDTILNATSAPQGFRQIRKSCKQHVDQQVSYFCFTCQTECVCSQCIIHGQHKNHQVKTIKKSVPLVRGKLDSIKMEIQNSVSSFISVKQNHQKNIKYWADSIDKHKRNVATAFQQFRLRIDAKEKQILSKFDKALQIATQDFGLCIKSVNHTIQQLRHGTKFISQIGSKDQVQLLNFYAIKKGELQKMKIKEGPREPSQVTKRKLDSNKVVISLANILTKLGQLDLQSQLKSQILMIQDNL